MEIFLMILFFIIIAILSLQKNISYKIGLCMFFGICLLLPFVFEISYDHVSGYIPNFQTISKAGLINSTNDEIEFGFKVILFLGSLIFNEYSYLMILIYYFIYYKWTNIFYKYNINIIFVLFLYLFYPFLLDAIQSRNFFASFFVLLGLFHLINNTPKNKFISILYIFLASSIHQTAILYLPFMFININSEKSIRITKVFAITCLFASLFLYFNYGFTNILSNLFEGRYTYYFEEQKFGFLIPTAQILSGYFLSSYIYKLERKVNKKTLVEIYLGNDMQAKYVVLLYCISLVSIFFVTLCIINNNFERMFRNLLILYYGLIWLAFKRYKGATNLIKILILSLIFFIGGNGLEYYRFSESEELLVALNIIVNLMNLF